MTVRFGNRRLGFYVAVFLLSATVLGIAANFARLFLPTFHHDFTIFALVVPSLTIFAFLLTLQWAQPRTEAVVLFFLWALWLAMGAWATDVIGNVQCDSLSASTKEPSVTGSISVKAYCYEMKVIQAFSWMLFVLFSVAFIILNALVSQAEKFGRYNIWEEPIRELPWFGEAPGYYNTSPSTTPMVQYPGANGYPAYPGYPGVMPTPGHSIIIQPGVNGQPPTVTQVPLGA
ncbi:hypothetical protein BDN72DRAFT_809657 [Pluteus cervinus]|uniref:Uncharacterized protein n=1 Tax=Pluteus cervinus TaxID=181527 RepID=A0ACD3BD83_9AGAR|nr:hypothetical protein BDN72DRAFT_809657 [Pluteus cervinus]